MEEIIFCKELFKIKNNVPRGTFLRETLLDR